MSTSQSLDRGLDILELLDRSPRPLGIREISRQLDLSPTIVQRLINTLSQRRYLRQDPETRRYGIGYQILGVGASLQNKDLLLVESRKEMARLTREMRVDAYLGVLQDDYAIYLLCVQSEGPVSLRSEPGQRLKLHSTAIGKVLLAALDDEAAKALLGAAPLPAITPATTTDSSRLVTSLAKVRAEGFALSLDENIVGITSVGAPIHNSGGEICAAISVAFSPHFSPELQVRDVIARVRQAADTISGNLGYTGPSLSTAAEPRQ